MQIYLENLKDPKAAIEFAKKCGDDRVWKALADHSVKNVEFLQEFLRQLPTFPNTNYTDPVEFIQRIVSIKELNDFEGLASNIVKEYRRKLRTAELAQNIVATDAFGAFKRSFERYQSATIIQLP
jgi:hypothetical protein